MNISFRRLTGLLDVGTPAGLTLDLSDDLNNWSDGLELGYGLVLGDDLNSWADDLVIGYGLDLTDDLNNWIDDLQIGYGLVLTDDADNLADAASVLLGVPDLTLDLSDDLNNWADDLQIGYGLILSDSIDFLADGSTTFTFEHELGITGESFTLTDAVSTFLGTGGLTLDLSDTLNSWADSLTGDKKSRWLDDASVATVAPTQLNLVLSDSINFLADGSVIITLDYEVEVTGGESFTLTDAVSILLSGGATGLELDLSDDLNVWSDSIIGSLRSGWQDSLSNQLAGSLLTLNLSDSLNSWADSLLLGYGLLLTDDANNLSDSLGTAVGPVLLTLSLGDDLNNWNDSAVVARSASSLQLSDNLNNWQDAVVTSVISGGAAVWRNLASVTLNVANLAAVTFLTQNLGNPGDVMYEDADDVLLVTQDTDSSSITYEDTDTAALKHQDTETV